MVVQGPGCGPGELFVVFAVERYLKQLHVFADFGRVENRLAVRGPDGEVAASLVKVRHVEEQNPALIPAEIRQLPQPCAITPHDVRFPATVRSADKQQPLAVGRPAWSEIELVSRLDVPLVGFVRVGDVDLIVRVIANQLAVGRRSVSISEAPPPETSRLLRPSKSIRNGFETPLTNEVMSSFMPSGRNDMLL